MGGTMSWIEYMAPIAIAISIFLVQMVIKGNTRTAVLEARVKKHDEEIDDMHDSYKENFARIFKSLEDIKIRLERMDASRNK